MFSYNLTVVAQYLDDLLKKPSILFEIGLETVKTKLDLRYYSVKLT